MGSNMKSDVEVYAETEFVSKEERRKAALELVEKYKLDPKLFRIDIGALVNAKELVSYIETLLLGVLASYLKKDYSLGSKDVDLVARLLLEKYTYDEIVFRMKRDKGRDEPEVKIHTPGRLVTP